MRRFFLLVGAAALVGQGCLFEPRLPAPSISIPIGEQTLETPIPQRNGFGEIPHALPAPRKPGASGSVRVNAEFPSLPPVSTVLRVRSGQPNAAELRNIAQALQLPQGSVGRQPRTQELILEWLDEEGRRWSYRGSEGLMHFEQDTVAVGTAASISDDAIYDVSLAFLRRIGFDVSRIGEPYLDPTARQGVAVVRFNAKQDGQGIWSPNGAARIGATLEIERANGRVMQGSFLVRQDPDRSDYATISRDEARKRLAAGGLSGTPSGDVVINTLSFEWVHVSDNDEPPTQYLYPAIIGTGEITFSDNRTGPYRIVVSLIQE